VTGHRYDRRCWCDECFRQRGRRLHAAGAVALVLVVYGVIADALARLAILLDIPVTPWNVGLGLALGACLSAVPVRVLYVLVRSGGTALPKQRHRGDQQDDGDQDGADGEP